MATSKRRNKGTCEWRSALLTAASQAQLNLLVQQSPGWFDLLFLLCGNELTKEDDIIDR